MKNLSTISLWILALGVVGWTLSRESAEASGSRSRWARYFRLVEVDDGSGNLLPTVELSGANLRIVNGLGATNGNPADPDSTDPAMTATNGLGNLIVGYNEMGNPNGDDRTGSHNVVFGHRNTFSSFGGMVGARDDSVSAAFA